MTQINLKEGLTVNLKKLSELQSQNSASGSDILPIGNNSGDLNKITSSDLLAPLVSGIGEAKFDTDPSLSANILRWNAADKWGTYANFKNEDVAITLTESDFEGMQSVQFFTTDGGLNWQVDKIPLPDSDMFLQKDKVTAIGNTPDSSYNLGSATTKSTRIFPWTIGSGKWITAIDAKGSKNGIMPIKLFERGSGNSFTFKKSIDITITSGIASYPASIQSEGDWYPGIYLNGTDTGGQISYKTITQEGFTFSGSNVMDTQTFTPTDNIGFAIEFTVTEYGDLKPIEDKIAPVTGEVEVGTDKIAGLVSGGTTPGTANTNFYFLKQQIDGAINYANFRASVAGTMEILLCTKNEDEDEYEVEVHSQTVVLGNNVITFNEAFVGRVGLRMHTAKFFFINTGGAGLSSISLASLGLTTSDPTPSTFSAASVEANNLSGWDISLVVNYKEITTENEVIHRLDILEQNPGSELNGAKFTALGDSIVSLAQGNTFASRIASAINSAEYVNYAIPGATWAYRPGTVATDNPVSTDDTNVVPNQVRKLIKAYTDGVIGKPDLILISAGINDVARNLALGDIATQFALDLESVNFQTLTGAMRWSITKLMQTFLDVRIVVCTPLLTSIPERNYTKTKPYSDQIKAVAARLAVPVIDCFEKSLINEVNEGRYMQPDLLHPNDLGQQMQFLFAYKELRNIYYSI